MEKEIQIPEQILELLNQKSYQQLSEIERELVLAHLSESEYIELHQASAHSLSYFKDEIKPSEMVRLQLAKAFAEQHQKPVSVFHYRIEIWKIAAILIPLFFAGIWTFNRQLSAQQLAGIVVRDTIFVQQKIKDVQHIIDTVIEYRELAVKQKVKASRKQNIDAHYLAQDTNLYRLQQQLNIGIRTLQAEDLNKSLEPKNGKSMEQDELLKHFSFAKI